MQPDSIQDAPSSGVYERRPLKQKYYEQKNEPVTIEEQSIEPETYREQQQLLSDREPRDRRIDDTVKFKSPRNPSDKKAHDPFDQNDYITSDLKKGPSAISKKQPQYDYRQHSGSEGKALISPAGSLSMKKRTPKVDTKEFHVPRMKDTSIPKIKYQQDIPEVDMEYDQYEQP